MKVFVAFACLFVVCQATMHAAPALLSTGTSSSSRTQDSHGNYAFAYNEQHKSGGSSRKESGNPHAVTGSYTLNVADGRQRIVKYVADGHGFRTAIATNEPGTAASYPAAASISSPFAMPEPVKALPVPVLAAPIAEPMAFAKAPLAEPLAYGYGYAKAPLAEPLAYGYGYAKAEPVAIAVAPAVSSYSTSINHAAPIAMKAIAAPLALPEMPALGYAKAYGYGGLKY